MEELFCLFLSEMLYKDIGGRSAVLKQAVDVGICFLPLVGKRFCRKLRCLLSYGEVGSHIVC